MKYNSSRSLKKLVQLGLCRPSDISQARAEAKRLLSPEYSARIRDARRAMGVLGDSNRLVMLLLISKREMCVCELESALGIPQPTASRHLALLETAGLVHRSRKGRWVFYRASNSPVTALLAQMIL